MVDVTSSHDLFSFVNAFSSYNQILMALENEEKTTFVNDHGIFYYMVILFGLKDAGLITSAW